MERVIVYIDGYNLYFGLKDAGFNKLKWIDIQQLVLKLLNSNQQLVNVKYFTTLVTNSSETRERQKTYIKALQTLDFVEIIFGRFQRDEELCRKCGNSFYYETEKLTDVGIATHIISDMYEDRFDMAMLISGDTDLLPPIRYINQGSFNKRVFVAFPPSRSNEEVKNAAKGSMTIGRKTIVDSQLPNEILDKFGDYIRKPPQWY